MSRDDRVMTEIACREEEAFEEAPGIAWNQITARNSSRLSEVTERAECRIYAQLSRGQALFQG